MKRKFSDRLKGLREKNDMTQEQLAKVSGVSPRTIQRYECGTSRPRLDAAEKLAKALNISVDQLLGTDGMLVAQAAEQYGARGAKQAQQLTDEVTGLFTGGELAQDYMDVMMLKVTSMNLSMTLMMKVFRNIECYNTTTYLIKIVMLNYSTQKAQMTKKQMRLRTNLLFCHLT